MAYAISLSSSHHEDYFHPLHGHCSSLSIPDNFAHKTCLSAFPTSRRVIHSLPPCRTIRTTYNHQITFIDPSHPVCLSSNNIPRVSKPQMQPCLYMRASIRGSAIPMFQKRHMHGACQHTRISPVRIDPDIILDIKSDSPQARYAYQPFEHAPSFRVRHISQANSASDLVLVPSPRQVITFAPFPKFLAALDL
jgi:hypothetical protein